MSFSVKNLEFNYFGEKSCIHSINLDCDKGQTVVIYGDEGSGKSSLLKVMTGLNKKCSGDILIDDRKLEDIEPKDRNLSLIIECNSLFNHKSVYKNIRYPLKIRKTDNETLEKKVDEVLALFDLNGIAGKKAYMLDYEEFTKTVLARMFVRDADYYFLDNPLNNLTGDKRNKLFHKLLPLFDKESSGYIYATDDLNEVMALNKMTYIISFGYVIQKDIFSDIIKNPVNLTVLKMLKENFYNILNIKISKEKTDSYDFKFNDLFMKIQDKDFNAYIGIPYSSVYIDNEGDNNAKITEIRCTGKGFLYNYQTDKGFKLLGFSEKNYEINKDVRIKVDFNQCLFYDKDTEFKIDLKEKDFK